MEGQEEECQWGTLFSGCVKDELNVALKAFNHLSGFDTQGDSSGSKSGDEDEEEVLDEETLRRDQVVKGAIDVLIREYASELNAPSQDPDSQPRNKKRKEKKEEVVFA